MTDSRKNIRLAIYIVPDKQHLMMTHFSENMSAGGVFIRTVNIQPVNTLMSIRFRLPDNSIVINCKAKVAWTNEPGHLKKYSLPSGMGIQFMNLSLNNIQAIRNFLNNVRS